MIKEAEENAESDRIAKEKVEARNQLESYLYGLRSTVEDTLKDKISDGDKAKIMQTVTDALSWLETSVSASKEEYDEKRKEVEAIANPIIMQTYKAASSSAGTGPAGPSEHDSSDDSSSGPTVEEVD